MIQTHWNCCKTRVDTNSLDSLTIQTELEKNTKKENVIFSQPTRSCIAPVSFFLPKYINICSTLPRLFKLLLECIMSKLVSGLPDKNRVERSPLFFNWRTSNQTKPDWWPQNTIIIWSDITKDFLFAVCHWKFHAHHQIKINNKYLMRLEVHFCTGSRNVCEQFATLWTYLFSCFVWWQSIRIFYSSDPMFVQKCWN